MSIKVNNVQVETTDGGTANVNRVVVKLPNGDLVTVFDKGVNIQVYMRSYGHIDHWSAQLEVIVTPPLDFP